MRKLYSYLDWHYTADGKSAPWVRIHTNDIEKVREQVNNYNVFTTIQQYKTDRHEEKELQFTPLYFDLDYKDDVEVALLDARSLVSYFGQMDIGQEHIRIWFSGSKGFHIVITPELFGIKPHEELTYIIKNACMYVAHSIQLRSFDTRVYSIRRMWRLPDSIHQKTNLYCIELSHVQLLNLSISEIRDLAKTKRGSIWDEEDYDRVDENPVCKAWFSPFISDYQTQKELQSLRPKNTMNVHPGEDPVCVKDLLINSIRKIGTRNQGEMALVSYYKDTGVDQQVSLDVVTDWVKKIPSGMTSMTDTRSLEADVKGVVRTVYESDHGDKYHFACHFIRALGTGTDKPIACAYEKCKFVNQEDQEPEKAIELKLPEASRAVYIGSKVHTSIMVSGRDDIPYGIPAHLGVTCKPDMARVNSVCLVCDIAVFGGEYEKKFGAKDQQILGLLETSDIQQKMFLRKLCGIPEKCNKHRMRILEYTNVVEIMAIPRINFRPDSINEDEPYVMRKGYFVGHDIEANKEYDITCYTYPDPKTQHLVHVIDEAKPLGDDISDFKPDKEMLDKLKKFQVTKRV